MKDSDMSRHSRLLRGLARENELDTTTLLTPEEVAEVEADTELDVEFVNTVEAPVNDIEAGFDEIEIAEVDQESLAATQELVEATLENDGQGLDPTAAELVSKEIEIAAERYALKRPQAFARESMNAVAGRKAVTRSLAAEAEAAQKGIGQRVKDGLKALYEMLSQLFKDIFDKATRYANRAKALKFTIGSATFKTEGDTKVALSTVGATDGQWPANEIKDASGKMLELAKKSKSLAFETQDDNVAIVIGKFGGAEWSVKRDGQVVTVESTPVETEGVFKVVDKAQAATILDSVIAGLGNLEKSKGDFDTFREGIKTAINVNKEGDNSDAQMQKNLRAVSSVLGKTSRAFIKTAGAGIQIVEQSIQSKTGGSPNSDSRAVAKA